MRLEVVIEKDGDAMELVPEFDDAIARLGETPGCEALAVTARTERARALLYANCARVSLTVVDDSDQMLATEIVRSVLSRPAEALGALRPPAPRD